MAALLKLNFDQSKTHLILLNRIKVCFLTANTVIIVFISTYYLISFTESPVLFLIWTSSIYFVSNGIHVLVSLDLCKWTGQLSLVIDFNIPDAHNQRQDVRPKKLHFNLRSLFLCRSKSGSN